MRKDMTSDNILKVLRESWRQIEESDEFESKVRALGQEHGIDQKVVDAYLNHDGYISDEDMQLLMKSFDIMDGQQIKYTIENQYSPSDGTSAKTPEEFVEFISNNIEGDEFDKGELYKEWWKKRSAYDFLEFMKRDLQRSAKIYKDRPEYKAWISFLGDMEKAFYEP